MELNFTLKALINAYRRMECRVTVQTEVIIILQFYTKLTHTAHTFDVRSLEEEEAEEEEEKKEVLVMI